MTAEIGFTAIHKVPNEEGKIGFYNVEIDCKTAQSFTSEFEVPTLNKIKVRIPLGDANETFEGISARAKIQLASDLQSIVSALM